MGFAFIFDHLGESVGDGGMGCFGWVVNNITVFEGFITEFVLLLFEIAEFLALPAFGEQGGLLKWDVGEDCFLD